MTIFGEMVVNRLGYSKPKLASVFPLDKEMNLPVDSFSPDIGKRVAEGVAKSAFEEVVASISEESGGHICEASG